MSDTPEVSIPAQEINWSPARTERLLRGSVATGAGLAMLSILWDQIRSARRKNKADAGKVLDDGKGTIEIQLPGPGMKVATGIEWIGGGAAALGTYLLIQKAYQDLRERQLKKEIEEAGGEHANALGSLSPQNKVAAIEKLALGVSEVVTNAPKDTLFISALLAAAGTYGLMENTWPSVSEKDVANKARPKRIVVKGHGTVIADGPGDGPLAALDKAEEKTWVQRLMNPFGAKTTPRPQASAQVDKEEVDGPATNLRRPSTVEMEKAASLECSIGKADQQAAAAMLAYCLSVDPRCKEASALLDIVGSHYFAPEKTEDLVKEAGIFQAIELSKGGKDIYEGLPAFEKRAAMHYAFRSPVLSPVLATLTIAELEELHPDMRKRAQVVAADPIYSHLGTKLASLLWSFESAAIDDSLACNEKVAAMRQDAKRQMGTLGLSESEDAGGDVDEADEVYAASEDPIDTFLLDPSPVKSK